MALPKYPVTLPADLVNAQNGRLSAPPLTAVTFPGRGRGWLHHQTARIWWAMTDACQKETGYTLTITSLADAFRTFAIQEATFFDRAYVVSRATYMLTASSRRRIYQGKYWKFYDWASPVATPGDSNHGLGIAFDVAILLGNGSIVHIASVPVVWAWVKENAVRFGLSWEYTKEGVEDWHMRMYGGDTITQAVLDFERHDPMSPWPPFVPGFCQYGLWPIADKPRIGPMSQGDVVLYAQGTIRCKAGGRIAVHGFYDVETTERVKDVQRFFNLTIDGWIGSETWEIIDWLSQQPNNAPDL